MKGFKALSFAIFFIFMILVHAKAGTLNSIYSQISTSFMLSKTVKCDELQAKFEVYAEGDNYSMALKRVTEINNRFLTFLKKTLSANDIKESTTYGYSKKAIMYVYIRSKKIYALQSILKYITNNNFQYKTAIKPIYIQFTVSKKLKNKVKNQLFMEALNKAISKLTMVNSILSSNYEIGSLDIETNDQNFNPLKRNAFKTFYKSHSGIEQTHNDIQIAPGTITINVIVKLKMIKKLN